MNMKFPINPKPSPNVNPGVKNDRGRIFLILIVTGIAYFVFSSWAGWEQGLGEIWDEIVAEVESELDINLSGDEVPSVEYEYNYDPSVEPEFEFEPEPLPTPTRPGVPIEVTTETNNFLDSNVTEDEARRILQESRQQVIEQLEASGQEDQIPMVLDMLDRMEADL